MFRSNLFVKSFSTIVCGVLLLSATFYFFSVPMINRMTFEMEERASRTFLDNMYQLVRQSHQDMEAWRASALEAHKRELRNIVQVAVSYIGEIQGEVKAGRLKKAEAQREILQRLRGFTYGKKDYIWVSDYKSTLISHPDPQLFNADFSQVRDVNGNLIVPPMVAGARQNGDGFYSYWWRRLGTEEPVEKLTYYRNLPDWQWVVGSGVYIDDVKTEVAKRRNELLEELRKHLLATPVAGSGYVFIFDSHLKMLIHPNANLEGADIGGLKMPGTDKSLAKELIAASRRPDLKLEYKWDKPDDPGHYVYNKIAWVKHFEGTDWYLAASVYTDDLRRSAQALTRRILFVSGLGLIFSIIGAFLFVQAYTTPIKRLVESANRVSRGDLDSRAQVGRTDEIGLLAHAFNNMVDQLKDQIRNLETRVAERTSELSGWVSELELRNLEIVSLKAMGDLLQACRSLEESYQVVARTLEERFPGSSGNLLMLDGSQKKMETVVAWGQAATEQGHIFVVDDCWGLRRGKPHLAQDPRRDQLCPHVSADRAGASPSLCIPMIAHGVVLGVLHLILPLRQPAESGDGEVTAEHAMRFAETVAEHTAMALANMKLRQTLHRQSVRDPLTGLFNRRYLDEALEREQLRAVRHGTPLAVLMLDVDHFKNFNDTYGHEAGDAVLRELGILLTRMFRGEDVVCRYGGEEFTVLLPGAGAADARNRAEATRRKVEESLRVSWREQTLMATVSIGVGCYPADADSAQGAMETADAALYQAKHLGRNRVEGSGAGETERQTQ